VNFGSLKAEICWRVWGTPANFNGFRVLAAFFLLHGTLQQQTSAKLWVVLEGMELWNFRKGRHLYSAGRPSRWASTHILVFSISYGLRLRDVAVSLFRPTKGLKSNNGSRSFKVVECNATGNNSRIEVFNSMYKGESGVVLQKFDVTLKSGIRVIQDVGICFHYRVYVALC